MGFNSGFKGLTGKQQRAKNKQKLRKEKGGENMR